MKDGTVRGKPSRRNALSGVEPELAAKLVSLAGDVALVLDSEGVIRNVAFGGTGPVLSTATQWVGQPWIDTVTSETRVKVTELLSEAAEEGVSRERQVNYSSPSGADIPISYSAVRVGDNGEVLAIGRDLRAIAAIQQRLVETQQAMERDYWQMRQAETRYRLLFQIATDAVMIVDAQNFRVVDANQAAGRLFGMDPDKLVGRAATIGIEPASHAAVEEMLTKARVLGRASEVRVRLTHGTDEAAVSALPFRSEGGTLLLMRVDAVAPIERKQPIDDHMAELVHRTPDAIVITDADSRVRFANAAFLDVAQLANEEQAKGRWLSDWVGRPGSDLPMVLAIVKKHGVARLLATSLRGEHGLTTEVELSAALLSEGNEPLLGFVIRGVDRRIAAGPAGTGDLTLAVERLTGLVGRVSLPELVRDTTDLVERHFIRAALELTGDNRTSAAEVLGLSRQSLYVKLRRHGLQSDDDDGAGNGGSP